jgi:hypothetical protein
MGISTKRSAPIPLMGMSMRLSTPGFLQITSMGISTKRSAPDTFYGHVYEEVLLHIPRGTDRSLCPPAGPFLSLFIGKTFLRYSPHN